MSNKVLVRIIRKQRGKICVGLAPRHKRIWKLLVILASGLIVQDGLLSPPGNSNLPSGAIYIRLCEITGITSGLEWMIQCQIISFWFCRNHRMSALERTSDIIYFWVSKFVADVSPLAFLHAWKISLIGYSNLYICVI